LNLYIEKLVKELLKQENRKKGVDKIAKKQVCIVCGEEHGLDDIHIIKINGKDKKICKGCATSIKGLV